MHENLLHHPDIPDMYIVSNCIQSNIRIKATFSSNIKWPPLRVDHYFEVWLIGNTMEKRL